MKAKAKENLEVNKYYQGVMFVKSMEQYKGKIFNIEFVRIFPYHELIHLITLEGVDGGYNFSFPMLEIIEEDE